MVQMERTNITCIYECHLQCSGCWLPLEVGEEMIPLKLTTVNTYIKQN